MGKVIPINNVTKLNVPVDKVLDAGKDKLKDAILIGYTKDDMEYFACTMSEPQEILWLIERFKYLLLDNASLEDEE